MSEWYKEFDSIFWTGICTMVFGGIALLVRYAFKSKCDNINLCYGCIQIHRVVEAEEKDAEEDETEDQNNEFKNP
jgi:hypothetical protein